MTGLATFNSGHTVNPWRVYITGGPSTGLVVSNHRLKREATAWITDNAHLPWHQLQPGLTVAEAPIMTVPTAEIVELLHRFDAVKTELETHKQALWHAHDAIVERIGYGTAHLLDRIRRGDEL